MKPDEELKNGGVNVLWVDTASLENGLEGSKQSQESDVTSTGDNKSIGTPIIDENSKNNDIGQEVSSQVKTVTEAFNELGLTTPGSLDSLKPNIGFLKAKSHSGQASPSQADQIPPTLLDADLSAYYSVMDPSLNATAGYQQPRKKTKFNTRLYKTELCRSWTELGYCPYGDNRCQFAHGKRELRPVTRHKKYKTVKCKNFLAGYCPYGSRCCFIHNEVAPDVEPGFLSSQNGEWGGFPEPISDEFLDPHIPLGLVPGTPLATHCAHQYIAMAASLMSTNNSRSKLAWYPQQGPNPVFVPKSIAQLAQSTMEGTLEGTLAENDVPQSDPLV